MVSLVSSWHCNAFHLSLPSLVIPIVVVLNNFVSFIEIAIIDPVFRPTYAWYARLALFANRHRQVV